MAQQRKILLVTYGGGHARMLYPVVERLSRDESNECIVLALTTAGEEFSDSSARILGYKDFFSSDASAVAHGQTLAGNLEKVIDYDETVAYLGKNYMELVDLHGEQEARSLYADLGRQAFEPVNTLTEILKRIGPDVVVATNAPRSEKAAILAARRLGIKSLALIDMFAIRCGSWFSDNAFADKILVLSESVKGYLVGKGRRPEDIVVTGNPAFDKMVEYYNAHEGDISAARKVAPFTVLWASQREPAYLKETDTCGDPSLPEKIESVLVEIFAKHRDWRLIARNHPSEVQRRYPDYVRVSTQTDDLNALLSGVHVVLTLTSTLGFQGTILGAQLVTIDCSVLTETMPFTEMGFSVGVDDFAHLERQLEEIADYKDRVLSPAYRIANAAERTAEEITRVLGQGTI